MQPSPYSAVNQVNTYASMVFKLILMHDGQKRMWEGFVMSRRGKNKRAVQNNLIVNCQFVCGRTQTRFMYFNQRRGAAMRF
ncbi:hypothetical protein PUN28_003102 [Cardiocondyla obscurior]|uniref:Uncharacterized protein n=1 Tax=Cardiocondyla obscurior TaxID=286306 RepID=A0AAW2GH89_9HYME